MALDQLQTGSQSENNYYMDPDRRLCSKDNYGIAGTTLKYSSIVGKSVAIPSTIQLVKICIASLLLCLQDVPFKSIWLSDFIVVPTSLYHLSVRLWVCLSFCHSVRLSIRLSSCTSACPSGPSVCVNAPVHRVLLATISREFVATTLRPIGYRFLAIVT